MGVERDETGGPCPPLNSLVPTSEILLTAKFDSSCHIICYWTYNLRVQYEFTITFVFFFFHTTSRTPRTWGSSAKTLRTSLSVDFSNHSALSLVIKASGVGIEPTNIVCSRPLVLLRHDGLYTILCHSCFKKRMIETKLNGN